MNIILSVLRCSTRSVVSLLALAMMTCCAVLAPATAHAALMAYEGFNYTAGTGNLTGQNGGAGWNGAWQTIGGSVANVVANSLAAGASSPSGYDGRSVGNNALQPNGSRAGRSLDTTAGGSFGLRGFIDASGRIGADGKTLYLSFMQQPNGTTYFYEFEFHRDNLSDPGRMAGIGNDSGAATGVYLRTPATPQTLIGAGSTAVNFYVVRIDFLAGNNDTVRVYMNPTSITEPGTPTLTKTGAGDMSFNGISFGSYNNSRTVAHDEIRFGETWDDVTPGHLTWVGDGSLNKWDFTTTNWIFGGLTNYQDASGVTFNDLGSDSPAVNLTSTVNPASVTFSNSLKNYTISGTGAVRSSGSLMKLGSGTVTLSATTTVSTLNANYGKLSITSNVNVGGNSGTIYVGNGAGTSGTLTLETGSSLVVTGALADAFVIGRDGGVGTIIQNGGTFTYNPNNRGDFYLGAANNAATISTYSLTNGTLDLSSKVLHVGFGSGVRITGNFNLAGGQVLNVGGMYIGESSGTGVVNVAGGTLNTSAGGYMRVGNANGPGKVTQTAGDVTVNAYYSMGLGGGSDGTGSYSLSGGSLTAAGDFTVHEANTSASSSSSFTQSGGTVNLNGVNKYIGRAATGGGQGIYSLSSGTLNISSAGDLQVAGANTGANGVLNVSGTGQLNINGLVALSLARTVNSTGAVNQAGGTVNIPAASTLGLWLGGGGAGANATYNLNGGTLALGTITPNSAAAATVLKFDGGTLRAQKTFSVPSVANFTTVINGNGAKLDSAGFDVTWTPPLLAGTGAGGLTKIGAGSLTLSAANTYAGATVISNGTLALGSGGSLAAASSVIIAAAATFDVSAVASPYNWGGSASLTASGTGTTVGTDAAAIKGGASGAVSMGSSPVALTFTPTAFTGDIAHPPLLVSQGALTLNNNTITITNTTGTLLGAGTYRLIQVNGGIVAGTPNAIPVLLGAGLPALHTAAIEVSGGNVNLVVSPPAGVDHFAITGIASSQTAGTVITNFTITAQDSGNNTVTAFGGAVTFGGTAGGMGVSPLFTAGVCTTASVTPTVAGSSLTITVDDLASHTGTTTITTVYPGPVGQFAIAPNPIASATAGTPFALTSITAKDAYGNACSNGPNVFTGTVNFSGTAGATGTSAGFSDGVLNTPSVTVTNAGSGKTITVNDGFAHTGTATITTVGPGPAAAIALTSGNNQSGLHGTALGSPFVVTVTDAYGNPGSAGTNVTFAVATTPSGATGQSLSLTDATTGGNGQASSTLTLGNLGGTYTVTATSGSLSGSPVTFTATANWSTGNGTWTNTISGLNWSDGLNWTNYTVADGSGNTANFNTLDLTADTTVHLDTPRTLSALIFGDNDTNSAGSWILDNSGNGTNLLTLAGGTPTITVNPLGAGQTATISAGLTGTAGLIKLGAGSLSLAGAVTNNSFQVNGGSLTVSSNLTINGTGGFFYVGNGGNNNGIGSCSGALTINPGATVVVAGTFGDALVIGRDSGSGTVVQNGGLVDFNVAGRPFIVGASSGACTAIYNMNGGTLNVHNSSLDLASYGAGVFTSTLNVTGGVITIGSGGMTGNAGKAFINLGGGTLAASANWASSLNMNLTNLNGSVTFDTTTNTITLSGLLSGNGGLIKQGRGTLTLGGANTYASTTIVSNGTLVLSAIGSLAAGSSVSIAAGATFDVSAVASPYNWGGSASLTASGTGTTVGMDAAAIKGGSSGTISLGARPIILTYDGSHPALYVSQGTLSLNGNAFTVASAPPLAVGTYTIVQQASGNITSNGTFTVTGTAIGSDKIGSIEVSGGNVNLVISNSPPKLAILSVNGGVNPAADTSFNVVVQAQMGDGTPLNVTADTDIVLTLTSGSGNLAGTLTGTVTAGNNSVTIGPVLYNKAESGVALTATRTSGDILLPANSAPFTVNYGPKVVILTPPQNLTLSVGSNGTFSVIVTGAPPISYQWYHGAAPIPDATNGTLTVTNARAAEVGSYQVIVTNSYSSTTSSVATLTLSLDLLLAYEGFDYAAGAALAGQNGGFGWGGAWTQIEGAADSVVSGNLGGGASVPSGYDALSQGNHVLNNEIRDGRFLNVTANGAFGLSGYLDGNGNVGADGKTLYVSFLQQPNGTTYFYEFEFHRDDLNNAGRIGGIGNDSGNATGVYLRTPATGQTLIGAGDTSVNFYVVRIDFKSGNNDEVRVYRNPTSSTEPGTPTLTKLSAGDMSFDGISFGAFVNSRTVRHDEVRVGTTWASVLGVLSGPPVIRTQPQSLAVLEGSNATFTIAADGSAPFAYHWLKGASEVAVTANGSFTINNAQFTDTADYSVIVSNDFGSVTSSVARLTVYTVSNNLLAHWKLDEISGLTAYDATANHFDGTLLNYPGDDSQWQFGLVGDGALLLNTNNRVQIASNPSLNLDSFTISFWMQLNSPVTNMVNILARERLSGCPSWGLEVYSNNVLNFFLFGANGPADVKASTLLQVGPIYHIACRFSHTNVMPDIFVNGLLVSTNRTSSGLNGPPAYDTGALMFGGARAGGGCALAGTFDGLLDDVQFYNKPLTDGEIAYLYSDIGSTLGPLTVSGQVALEAFTGPARDGAGTRSVTFKATDATGAVLGTWDQALPFTAGAEGYGVAPFTLTGVPAGTAQISAKSPWNLRKRLPVSFLGGAGTASFTGISQLPGGDLDGSNVVDLTDYFQLATAWYQVNAAADIDGSGMVDLDDYFIMANHWNETTDPE